MTSDLVTYLRALDTAICQRNEARAEVENLYDRMHRLVDGRAKAQLQADRLREQNYELQLKGDEARAEVERLQGLLRSFNRNEGEQVSRLIRERNELLAELERLRAEARAEVEGLREALRDIERGDYSDPMCERTPEQRAREALEAKP